MIECIYCRENSTLKKTSDGRIVHICDVHGSCVIDGDPYPFASCSRCEQRLPVDSDKIKSSFLDPLIVQDKLGARTHALRGLISGCDSFLVCGGPSAKSVDIKSLERRGIWSLAVNNMAGYYKPSAFVCSDPPSKFHNGIWLDPGVMKFVPTPKLRRRRGRIREKIDNAFFEIRRNGDYVSVSDCPNVWGFGRRAWLSPDDTFFTETEAAWGNHDAGVLRTKENKTVCTMLLAIRVLYYLGSRRIYLVGVDFNMDPSRGENGNYAFGEQRDANAIKSNNSQFAVVNDWLVRMENNGVFSKFGLKIYNCCQTSGLRAFEYVPFDAAISAALSGYPKEPFDLLNWYLK